MNKYILLPNMKDLNVFKAKGFNSFILPLKDYSIGFETYYTVDEINELSKNNDIYIIINKFLHKKEIETIKDCVNSISNRINKVFIEDLGLLNILPKEKVIIYQNHMINNYKSINFLKSLGYSDVVINNSLTINEINEIRKNTESSIYYFIISKNVLMYSKRKLVSNYFIHFNLKNEKFKYLVKEEISKKELIVKEEDKSTTISNNDIFCGNKYLDSLKKLDYLVINLTNIDKNDINLVLDNYDNENLYKLIRCDYYFLENEIKYKVGDLE